MSLFPDEDILTKEIETWRGFIDKLPTDEDKSILKKLLNDCYRYSIANTIRKSSFYKSSKRMQSYLSSLRSIFPLVET